MRNIILAAIALLFAAGTASATQHPMKPFILAWKEKGDVASVAEKVRKKLEDGGFQVAGSYSPYAGATVIVVTNEALKNNAAQSEFGGYGAAQRIAVTDVNGEIQVSYTNPSYMASAYRMAGDLSRVRQQLAQALGGGTEFGLEEGMNDEDLREYHYMFGMEYFDEPSVLNEYGGYKEAVAAVEKGLAAKTGGVTKVYRIDIPGKEETVFGVGLDGAKGEGDMQDDAYIMEQIDFGDVRSTAHLPYEILVSGDKAYALYARFRIAINFPDLSMMGFNSFMSILQSPETIERALTRIAGGKVKKPR